MISPELHDLRQALKTQQNNRQQSDTNKVTSVSFNERLDEVTNQMILSLPSEEDNSSKI